MKKYRVSKGRQLKWYAKQARASGFRVNGGANGGGWIRLAASIGAVCSKKGEARSALAAKFGHVPNSLNESVKTWRLPSKVVVTRPAHVNSDEFLSSYEWRRVRMVVLQKFGARCQCCGATPSDGVKMHVDHIKPRRFFPELALDPNNLQILCEVCNHGKGNWDQTDWRPLRLIQGGKE